MPKILLIKTSSMGDVIHNLPVVSDIRSHLPGARIDWVVEESFAGIPRLHPGVAEVIPVAVRRWRKTLLSAGTRAGMRAFGRRLRETEYDVVLDTQGLIKSAVIARVACGLRCGYAWESAREPAAALGYDRTFHVSKSLHAVERNRLLAAQVFGYAPQARVDYGIRAPAVALPWLPAGRYAVLLHATSRDDKLWPEADWVALGQHFNRSGLACILPWGGAHEEERSRRLAAAIAQSMVPPALGLEQLAALLAGAEVTVGVDTGLTHLAAALEVPVVALYCTTRPALTGVYTSGQGINLGGEGGPPGLASVVAAAGKVMKHA